MIYILYGLLVLLAASLFRLIFGPTMEDRILAISVVSVMIILIICLYSVMYNQSYYLDIALVYALLSFAEVLAFAKFTLPNTICVSEDVKRENSREAKGKDRS